VLVAQAFLPVRFWQAEPAEEFLPWMSWLPASSFRHFLVRTRVASERQPHAPPVALIGFSHIDYQ